VTFDLPFPPSVNDMYIRGRILSEDYRIWRLAAHAALRKQGAKLFQPRAMVKIDLDMKRKGDCDNRAKPVLDALVNAGVLKNDSKTYVQRVSIGWEPILDGCRVKIEAA
jgi:crossover junction endodeoxyribonuclease RusA